MHILLAEDDPNISLILQICLEKIGGHSVHLSTDGESALQTAKQKNFDLVILDGMMPKLSGLEVAKALVSSSSAEESLASSAATNRAVPIIFLSAKTDHRDVAEFLKIGAGYIAKPFDPQTICERIDNIITAKNKTSQGKIAA